MVEAGIGGEDVSAWFVDVAGGIREGIDCGAIGDGLGGSAAACAEVDVNIVFRVGDIGEGDGGVVVGVGVEVASVEGAVGGDGLVVYIPRVVHREAEAD